MYLTTSVFPQLWMQNGKQNRIPMEPKFDGRGVPSAADNQLGRHPMGETTVRAMGDTVRTRDFRTLRIASSHVHRLQGNDYLYIFNNNYKLRIQLQGSCFSTFINFYGFEIKYLNF